MSWNFGRFVNEPRRHVDELKSEIAFTEEEDQEDNPRHKRERL